jgi:hypothetical protein
VLKKPAKEKNERRKAKRRLGNGRGDGEQN